MTNNKELIPINTIDLRKLAEMIHLLMCKRKHTEGECSWYYEQQLDVCWEETFHKKWLGVAEGISIDIGDVKKAINIIQRITNTCSSLMFILNEFPDSSKIIKTIIDLVIKDA